MSDLAKLFETDPLELTTENIDAIVARMREAQAQYELGVRAPVTPKKTGRPKKSTADLLDGLASENDLKDLGL